MANANATRAVATACRRANSDVWVPAGRAATRAEAFAGGGGGAAVALKGWGAPAAFWGESPASEARELGA